MDFILFIILIVKGGILFWNGWFYLFRSSYPKIYVPKGLAECDLPDCEWFFYYFIVLWTFLCVVDEVLLQIAIFFGIYNIFDVYVEITCEKYT